MATFSFVVIAALLAVSSAGVLGTEPDANLTSTNADQRDHCIVMMGGVTYDYNKGRYVKSRVSYEYYHPDADVACDVKRLPLSWRDNIKPEYPLTCSLSAANQIVTVDADIQYLYLGSTSAAVYSLENRTVRHLSGMKDKVYKNGIRRIRFLTHNGLSQCIACRRSYSSGFRGATPLKCWKYDARKAQPIWEPTPGAVAWEPVTRSYHWAVWLTDNDLYVVTEDPDRVLQIGSPEQERRIIRDVTGNHNRLYRYNMSTGRLDQKQSAPGIRYSGFVATALSSTELLLCGGNAHNNPAVRECDIYDTTKGRWHATGRMNVGRVFPSLVTFNGEVYAIAGWTQDSGEPLLSVERYNRTSGMWTLVKPLKEAKERALAIVL